MSHSWVLDADWLLTSLRTPLLSSLCVMLEGVSLIPGIMVPSSFPLLIPLSLSFPSPLLLAPRSPQNRGNPLPCSPTVAKSRQKPFSSYMRTHVTFCSSDCQSLSLSSLRVRLIPAHLLVSPQELLPWVAQSGCRIIAVFKVTIHASNSRDAEAQAGILGVQGQCLFFNDILKMLKYGMNGCMDRQMTAGENVTTERWFWKQIEPDSVHYPSLIPLPRRLV